MKDEDMTYALAKEYILANWFDGDENAKAVVDGDEEHMAMKRAVEALEFREEHIILSAG